MNTTESLNSIAYAILNTIKGRAVNTEKITLELIKYHINNVRALLIKQDANKGYSADPYIIQDLGCIEVEKVDSADCCNDTSDCIVLRTKVPIPSVIELHKKQLITRVGPIDKTGMNYDWIDYSRVPFIGMNQFTKKRIKAYQIDNGGYIYLITPTFLSQNIKKINVQAVLEDPTQALEFKNCDESSCYDDDKPYPIKGWMIPSIINIVIDKFLNIQDAAEIDDSNNSKQDNGRKGQ
jgi:hypothetical protein